MLRPCPCAPVPLQGLYSSGQLPLAFKFINHHPDALSSIVTLSMAATIGEEGLERVLGWLGGKQWALWGGGRSRLQPRACRRGRGLWVMRQG